ncbi:hypothetical protein [Pseudoalteromonas sp. JSTW]|uniref:hypothetical protein n=1 Tax=Pseudoalteromonas sp. JSTW TaxID=2752475 RepID=UPI0015D56FAF|nr:hypothetical protein [Pseudoalteromonas sp. JSTW]QLJ07240.1 hypothetical protein GZH31_10570 [Pseudoalteromonas sp. JSTW]
MKKEEEIKKLAEQLEKDLLQMYGSPLLSGDDLKKAMGYRSVDALRQAIARKTVPVNVFSLKNRRGKYALIKDIALWLAKQSIETSKEEKHPE